MKNLVDYIKEEGIAPSIGDMEASSTYATPGNTMGMGNPKPPTLEDPGTEPFGATKKMKPTAGKRKKKTRN